MTLPAETAIRELIQRTALLHQRFGSEIGKRPLVLPNGKFFPDRFAADEASVQKLLGRMQSHAGLTDIPIEAKVIDASKPTSHCGGGIAESSPSTKHDCSGDCGGKGCKDCDGSCHHSSDERASNTATTASCSTGCGTGCGSALPQNAMGDEPRLVDLGNGWRVQVPVVELAHPVALTTNLVRTLSLVFLAETSSPKNPTPPPLELSSELMGCLLGFGGLLLAGSYIYSKSCGGPRIGRVTALPPFELALATVLFAQLHGHDLRPLLRELEVTQKDAVQKASEWLSERPRIAERFLKVPDQLAAGDIPLQVEQGGLFSRLFGKKNHRKNTEDELAELEAMLAQQARATSTSGKRPDPKADELRALVDEALASAKSAAD